MKSMMRKTASVVAISTVILLSQGCGAKWLQSGGDNESERTASEKAGSASAQKGGESNYPGLSGGGSSSELSGFSHNPQEERLAQAQGGFPASLSPSDVGIHRRAELTREEKAAIEAGLQDVFFGYDQWTISHSGMESLNRGASYLKDHPRAVLKIEGHCDERGTTDYNMVLGDKRAKAARTYLIEAGVSAKQVAIVSFGKERPFCFDHEESCYQQNRRGHMLLGVRK